MKPHIQKKTNEEIFEAIQMLASQMDQRFAEVDQRFAEVDQRFEQIDKRFEEMDSRFDRVEEEIRLSKKEFQEYTKKTDERFADVYDLIRPLHRRALENYRAPY